MKCRVDAAPIVAIPAMGTPEMQITLRSSVIGGIPRPEAKGTERREAGREVFGETIERGERRPDRPDHRVGSHACGVSLPAKTRGRSPRTSPASLVSSPSG